MNCRLLPATDADRDWLDALRRAAYRDLFYATWGGWDEARHTAHFTASWDQGTIQVVECESVRVGMLQLFEHPDAVEVGEIQIHPDHQDRGIGSRLLRDVQAHARSTGKSVILRTGLKNTRAVSLYEQLGFVHVTQTETHFEMVWKP